MLRLEQIREWGLARPDEVPSDAVETVDDPAWVATYTQRLLELHSIIDDENCEWSPEVRKKHRAFLVQFGPAPGRTVAFARRVV